jgi:ribonucleoside-diphosphate reductase alpha chain
MRWLASRFLDVDAQEDLGILTPEVRARKAAQEAVQSVSVSDTAGPVNEEDGEPADTPHASTGNGGNGGNGGTSAPTTALTDTPPVIPVVMKGLDLGPACGQCGGMMQRTGSCYTCSSCGNNTGCG